MLLLPREDRNEPPTTQSFEKHANLLNSFTTFQNGAQTQVPPQSFNLSLAFALEGLNFEWELRILNFGSV